MNRRTLAIVMLIEFVGAIALGVGLIFAVRIAITEFIPVELRAGAALLILVVAGMAFAWIVDTLETAIVRRARRRNGGLQA